jgi:hypothetical protein
MDTLSEDRTEDIKQIAATMNERLDSYSLGNATKALNLSCSIAVIPGTIIIVLVLVFSKFNWIITAISTLLIGVTVFLLANLASSLSRSRSMERLYTDEIQPEINNVLDEYQMSREQFTQIAQETLQPDAPLLRQIMAESS